MLSTPKPCIPYFYHARIKLSISAHLTFTLIRFDIELRDECDLAQPQLVPDFNVERNRLLAAIMIIHYFDPNRSTGATF